MKTTRAPATMLHLLIVGEKIKLFLMGSLRLLEMSFKWGKEAGRYLQESTSALSVWENFSRILCFWPRSQNHSAASVFIVHRQLLPKIENGSNIYSLYAGLFFRQRSVENQRLVKWPWTMDIKKKGIVSSYRVAFVALNKPSLGRLPVEL